MEDNVKQALLDGTATIQTEIEILSKDNTDNVILTEENGIVSWDYEDFRYVKDEGWIGQFVAKQVNGVVKNISDDFSMTDKELILRMGVKIDNETTWYSLGNFLVTKVTDDEVGDKTTFEALDYTKKFNQKYMDNITYPCTVLELAQNVCQQCGCELGNTNFKHNDWEITGNAFTNGESCRDVLKAIGKLAYSWVRVDWDNKVYLDFTVNKTTEEYNKITNHEYYTLKTQKEKIGAINRVVIGYKDIEGERTKVENTEDIETNGVHEITIFDNPLVYNQELRKKAIIGAEELLGLEYMPMEMLTVGHPWLRGDELLEVTDMEGNVHKTVPFDRTIQYFGHIKTNINVATNTKTNTEYSYEGGVGGRLRKTEISVDKINGQIIEIIKEQDETTEKLNETISTVDETKQTISKVETTVTDITTTTQTSTGGDNLHIEKALESNALDYVIEGMSYQETTAGKNKFDNILNQSGATRLTSSVFKIEPNTTYTFSTTADNIQVINYYKDIDKVDISNTAWETLPFTYTTPDNCHNIQLLIRRNDDSNIVPSDLTNAQLEEGSVVTDHEPYIPRPNPDYPQDVEVIEPYNLFDKDNITIIEAVVDSNNGKINPNVNTKSFYMKIPEGVDVLTVSRSFGERFCVGTTDVIPATNVTCLNYIGNNSAKAITIPVLDNSKYIIVYYYNKNIDTSTDQEILNSIQITNSYVDKPYTPFGSIQTKITRKNYLDTSKFVGKTSNGMTASINDDKSIKFVGTTTALSNFWISNVYDVLKAGTYKFITNVDLTGKGRYALIDATSGTSALISNQTKTYTFTITKDMTLTTMLIQINADVTLDDDFYIMLIKEEYSEEYETYQEKNVYINLQGNFIGKIGDIKDELRIENGRAILTKRIGKFIPNGNTNIFPVVTPVQNNSKFYGILSDFKATNNNLTQIYSNIFTGKPANIVWLNDIIYSCSVNGGSSLHFRVDTTLDNATLVRNFLIDNNCYFIGVLTEPYEVDLGDINVPLFEGTNNISLIQDLETTTSIRYLRETPLSGDSLLKQQLDATNDGLSDINNQVNQNTSDINNTNVNLNNNYYNKNQIDVINSSTSQELTQIKNSVETKITAEDLNIAIAEIKTTGVTSVTTETGYTFDKDGLKIQKSDSEMSSLLDNDGLVVKRDNTEVLTVRSAGVETENLTVRTYFTIGDNTRVENYKGGTGFFYVGGAD